MPSDNLDGDNPCHAHACHLQTCLQKSLSSLSSRTVASSPEDSCKEELLGLYRCCGRFYQKEGREGKRVDGCPVPEMVQKKLEKLGQEVKF